jgi:dihydrofolate reductase
MGKLIYLMNVSLDGFIESPERRPDWVPIDDEVHGWFNEQTRHQGAEIYGRRMYEVMSAYWPHAESDPDANEVMLDYARVWNPIPKLVFSSTLDRVEWNSRLATGDPADELARLRVEVDGDIGVSGPTIAAAFIRRGLVDEFGLMVHPVVLGAGTPYWPAGVNRMDLDLVATRTFSSGAVYLSYAARR